MACSVYGCEKEEERKGYCRDHAESYEKYGNPEYIENGGKPIEECLVKRCRKNHEALGYCNEHLTIFKETGSPYRTKVWLQCGWGGCKEEVYKKQMCREHYEEWRKALLEHGVEENV
jgi:hypothetical protein